MAAPGFRCEMARKRGRADRQRVVNLSEKRPQTRLHRTCRPLRRATTRMALWNRPRASWTMRSGVIPCRHASSRHRAVDPHQVRGPPPADDRAAPAPLGRRRGDLPRTRRDHGRLRRHRDVPDHDHPRNPRTPGGGLRRGRGGPPAGAEPPARRRRQAPDPDRFDAPGRPRRPGRAEHARRPAIAAALDLHEHPQAGRAAPGPGPSGRRADGGGPAQGAGLQPPGQPQDQGGGLAPRPRRPVRAHRRACPRRSSGAGSRSSRWTRRRRSWSATTRTAAGSGVPRDRPRG